MAMRISKSDLVAFYDGKTRVVTKAASGLRYEDTGLPLTIEEIKNTLFFSFSFVSKSKAEYIVDVNHRVHKVEDQKVVRLEDLFTTSLKEWSPMTPGDRFDKNSFDDYKRKFKHYGCISLSKKAYNIEERYLTLAKKFS